MAEHDQLMMGWQMGTKDLAVEIDKAISYYTDKYGVQPNTLHLNPSCEPDIAGTSFGLTITYFTYVRPSLFYIGYLPEKEEESNGL